MTSTQLISEPVSRIFCDEKSELSKKFSRLFVAEELPSYCIFYKSFFPHVNTFQNYPVICMSIASE